ncbi:LysR family transcriptional regulator [Paracoccus aerius]|uniref:Hydrogen peroxide-inducible genes activator n=1 Tax=Paracoccus aerius TaxID=1915382 RepID=A0ABS1S9I7_9RHOB|nr:hydrogen peroxide-inducible genes activator [Paracoccus aerius]MBL3674769.1 hydrogen peroxide-inducible genes activator [Paracoccus aerius]GHG28485.1 LysR family transcriptional regulator [Paracoccus aerius]
MPTLQQLRYLLAIADTLNFSRAAEQCHVTQPTLSIQVKELEARLGTKLVERSRTRVLLTPVGAEIARRARIIVAEIDDIRDIARREDPHAMQSLLRMGVVHTVGAYVLSIAMPTLRQSYQQTRIHVREERSEELQGNLADGQYDVILLPEIPVREDFAFHVLVTEPLHLVVPQDHRLAGHKHVQAADLAGETILTMERREGATDDVARLCRDVGAIQASDYVGTTLDTLRQMVAAGMGIALLPALYVRSEVMREELVVAIPLNPPAPTRSICMAWRKSSQRAETYTDFAETISVCLRPWDVDAGR